MASSCRTGLVAGTWVILVLTLAACQPLRDIEASDELTGYRAQQATQECAGVPFATAAALHRIDGRRLTLRASLQSLAEVPVRIRFQEPLLVPEASVGNRRVVRNRTPDFAEGTRPAVLQPRVAFAGFESPRLALASTNEPVAVELSLELPAGGDYVVVVRSYFHVEMPGGRVVSCGIPSAPIRVEIDDARMITGG